MKLCFVLELLAELIWVIIVRYLASPYLHSADDCACCRLMLHFVAIQVRRRRRILQASAADVDTGRLLPLAQQVPREQRYCIFCASGSAEDEHHFVFDCPAYCAIRNKFTNIFWGPAPTLSSFFTLHDPKAIARFLRECFEHRNTLVATQTGHSL